MLKDLIEIGKQVFALAREIRQGKTEAKDLRERQNKQDEEIKELRQELRRVVELMQRFAHEHQRQSDKSEADRKMLLMEMEIMILRYTRGLPPPDKPTDEEQK